MNGWSCKIKCQMVVSLCVLDIYIHILSHPKLTRTEGKGVRQALVPPRDMLHRTQRIYISGYNGWIYLMRNFQSTTFVRATDFLLSTYLADLRRTPCSRCR